MQALLGFTSEARWLRYADRHLRHLFPYLPGQSGYNKRLRRAAGLLRHLIRAVACDTACGATTCGWWTPRRWSAAAPGRRPKRSALAGWAEYGYCASHSRYFWGLRLHLVCTLHGLPVAVALTGAKADERQTLLDLLAVDRTCGGRPGQMLIADKNYYGREFERMLAELGVRLLRPARKGEPERAGGAAVQAAAADHRVGQPDLQGPARPGTPRRPHPCGVAVRVLQRILALTAAIWHNDKTGQPILRSLVAYDH